MVYTLNLDLSEKEQENNNLKRKYRNDKFLQINYENLKKKLDIIESEKKNLEIKVRNKEEDNRKINLKLKEIQEFWEKALQLKENINITNINLKQENNEMKTILKGFYPEFEIKSKKKNINNNYDDNDQNFKQNIEELKNIFISFGKNNFGNYKILFENIENEFLFHSQKFEEINMKNRKFLNFLSNLQNKMQVFQKNIIFFFTINL